MTFNKKDEQEPFLAGGECGPNAGCNSQKDASPWINLRKTHSILFIVQAAFLALNVSLLIFNTLHLQYEIKAQFTQEEVEEPYCG